MKIYLKILENTLVSNIFMESRSPVIWRRACYNELHCICRGQNNRKHHQYKMENLMHPKFANFIQYVIQIVRLKWFSQFFLFTFDHFDIFIPHFRPERAIKPKANTETDKKRKRNSNTNHSSFFSWDSFSNRMNRRWWKNCVQLSYLSITKFGNLFCIR